MSYGELISGGTNVLDYAVAVPTHLGTSPVSRITGNFSFLQVVPEPVLEKFGTKKILVPEKNWVLSHSGVEETVS